MAAIDHFVGHVVVDRPAHGEVADVPGHEPGEDEDAEGNVASRLVSRVLENLCRLRVVSKQKMVS